MPFYNNSRIGGAMDGTHIYYNTNIANDWASVSYRPSTVWKNQIYQIGEYIYYSYAGSNYWQCIALNTVPPPNGTVVPQPPPDGPGGLSFWANVSNANMKQYTNTVNKNEIIRFDQTRAQPYLANPSEYYMSVQRFTIESLDLPLFIPQGRVGSLTPSNIDLSGCETIYQITVETGGAYTTKPVKWIPQNTIVPTNRLGFPSGRLTPQNLLDPAFYCYSYAYFIQMINNTLQSFSIPNHPLMQFDPKTGLFSIQGFVDRWRTSSTGTPLGSTNPSRLFFNTALYNLFSSLSAIYTAIPQVSNADSANYQILFTTGSDSSSSSQPYITNVVPDTYHNITPLIPPAFNSSNSYVIGNRVTFSGIYYEAIAGNPSPSTAPPNTSFWVVITLGRNDVINTQEYTTLPLWSPVKSIVFTASLLNVVSEMVATPVVYQDVYNQVGGQQVIATRNINAGKPNTDILPILVEYSVPQTTGTEYKPFIFYEPRGEYRLSDLYSDVPIAGLQYKVFWKDSLGNLNPLTLGVGASSTLKILFRRKKFNSDKL